MQLISLANEQDQCSLLILGLITLLFAAKTHVITGIEISILKKKYSMLKYQVHKVSVSIL